jgi:hypothetical protein
MTCLDVHFDTGRKQKPWNRNDSFELSRKTTFWYKYSHLGAWSRAHRQSMVMLVNLLCHHPEQKSLRVHIEVVKCISDLRRSVSCMMFSSNFRT